MELATLQDLLVEELKDLYNAEQQMTTALPKMMDAAHSQQLMNAFQEHLSQTDTQIRRLDQVFQMLGESPQGVHCKGMAGIIAEGEELVKKNPDPDVLDAGLIAATQRVEHYEIAAYGSARTYAKELGKTEIARMLQETLDEEGDFDKKLTRIAEGHVNTRAAAPV